MNKKEQILKLLKAGKDIEAIAKAVKVKPTYVYYIRWMDLNKSSKKAGKKAKKKAKTQRDRELALVRARDSRMLKEVKEVKQALDVIEKEPGEYKFGFAIPKREGKPWHDDPAHPINKPTKLFVQPQHKDAAMKILADNDLVNHPPHYKSGGIDYWDFAEAKGLTENAYLFNAGKYIVRCGKKEGADPIQDLEKAIKFIQRDIDRRKSA